MTESKSTDKLRLLLEFVENNITTEELKLIESVELKWIVLDSTIVPDIKVKFK